ncbi:hypothetical protein S101258_00347 [Lactiplantibacillus plantarum subsp. plantarum]|uniref:Uncharacterized protein n=1 Tax=Lactiplantibacillus plantarum subsp. plantarum TaxID=337330 RepID=A0A2S3UA64_LACPN|nr:hypothetical protein S101258_00347 [Lactiplantibacillus plantarum subsp. plantarum]
MSESQPKVYILHENLDWTRHLVTWLQQKQIPYETLGPIKWSH